MMYFEKVKVKSMSRSEALKELQNVLVTRRDALRTALKGDLSSLRELTGASGELADFALDSACEETTNRMVEVESMELAYIDEALARINSGEYGACQGCDKPIPLARLEALPQARLCIKCQIKLEKSGFRDWSEMAEAAYDSVDS